MEQPETNEVPKQVDQPVGEQGNQQEKPQDDILTRVTNFMSTNEPKEPVDKDTQFDASLKDEITDPKVKEYLEAKEKSLERGFQSKFQEIAELRKALESQTNEKWSPERIQSLMNDQEFLQAAQSVVQTDDKSSDEWSALSEDEKAKIQKNESELAFIKQKYIEQQKAQEDAQLKEKYGNYDPQKVDTITADMLKGNVQATREHIYKAFTHDENVKRAYEMGRKDALSGNNEAYQAASIDGQASRQESRTPVEAKEGESTKSVFRRIAEKAMRDKQLK